MGSARRDRVRVAPAGAGETRHHSGHRDVPGHAAGPSGRRTISRSRSCFSRPKNPSACSSSRSSSRRRRWRASSFFFPPIIDTKIDQPQAEIVIDHDKVAALGLNLQQIGADISAAVGGNYVNRFNIAGRSYKVIPQIKRVRAPESRAADRHLRHRAGRQTDPAQHRRDDSREDRAAFAEPHAAAQRGHDQRHVRSRRSIRR